MSCAILHQQPAQNKQHAVITLHQVSVLGTAGRNSVGQLGVGGNADVHEPSTLQVQHKHEQSVCLALAIAASDLINKFIPGPFTQQIYIF